MTLKQPNQWTSAKMTDADYVAWFKSKAIVSESGCWMFQGFVHPINGYGQISFRGKPMRAHRAMYLAVNGSIPDGMHVCHTCDVRRCINPDHLWLGTNKQNLNDAKAKGRLPKMQQTHCKRGHEFTPENTVLRKPSAARASARRCRECLRTRWQREKAAKQSTANNCR
jgi:hypothetical protein